MRSLRHSRGSLVAVTSTDHATRAKSTGAAGYGIDVMVPDLRVAIVKRSPTFGGKVKSFDPEPAKKFPGVEAGVEEGPFPFEVRGEAFRQAASAIDGVKPIGGPR